MRFYLEIEFVFGERRICRFLVSLGRQQINKQTEFRFACFDFVSEVRKLNTSLDLDQSTDRLN